MTALELILCNFAQHLNVVQTAQGCGDENSSLGNDDEGGEEKKEMHENLGALRAITSRHIALDGKSYAEPIIALLVCSHLVSPM